MEEETGLQPKRSQTRLMAEKKQRDTPEIVTVEKKIVVKERELTETERLQKRIVRRVVEEALAVLQPFVHDFSKLQETQKRLEDLINIMMGNAALEKEVLLKINQRLEVEL